MRHTFSLVCAGLLALTLLAGCEKTTAPKTVRAPLSVETLTVEAADQPRWITLLGQAEGGREVEVKSQVSGILKKVAFTEGAEVKAGDVLIVLEAMKMEIEVSAARRPRLQKLKPATNAPVRFLKRARRAVRTSTRPTARTSSPPQPTTRRPPPKGTRPSASNGRP